MLEELIDSDSSTEADSEEAAPEDYLLAQASASESLLTPDILLMQQAQQIAQLSESPLPQADPYFLI